MKTFFFVVLFFAAFAILIADGYESKNDLVLNTWMNEYNKPVQNGGHIRPKRKAARHWCGLHLNKRIAEACPSCNTFLSSTFKRSVNENKNLGKGKFNNKFF